MNALKTTLLLGALTLLFIYGGAALGGRGGMIFAFILAIGMNFFAYFYSDKLVLRMYKAREVTEADAPWLYDIVRNLAMKADTPMPKVYMIPGDQPNAFATGRNPSHAAVAVTQGITSVLDKDELAGVLAHEMAHVVNRDILIGTIAATIAGAISMVANMAQWSMIFGGRDDRGGNPIAAIAMMIIAPVAAMLVQMAISRTREYAADRTGAQLMGTPEPLARALGKLHNASRKIPMNAEPATAHMFIVSPLSGNSLAGMFSTHPPIEKRIAALREMRYSGM
ncbi:Peptidase M48, Ste24p precursor [hydrothermal vent metagenome]|uniref:Peptidase M48, Ste24p n=1 Tax=hydrothermal vent metagenome TaxID=652676 RepID=A0A3B1BFT1_9ZZZZ